MPRSSSQTSSPGVTRRRFLTGGAAGLAGLAAAPGALAGGPAGAAGRFEGRVVLITGATSGIGEATARAFAAEGARVFFCGRRAVLGEEVAASIRAAGGEATFYQADVREEAQMAAFVSAAVEAYGGLDVGFNNAGIEGPEGALDEIDLDGEMGYRDVMRTNHDGVFFAMRHELPVMRQRGGGVIINTGSVLGARGSADFGAYAASKHAVIGLTRSAARAHANEGIRILAVSPGPVATDLLRRMYGDLEPIRQRNPLGVAEPAQIASMVLQLASPDASFVTGANMRVDGGSTA
jgi:NAD(P)-dependent dehydrogenase (short-subunit alcohol dehydrogenase family)